MLLPMSPREEALRHRYRSYDMSSAAQVSPHHPERPGVGQHTMMRLVITGGLSCLRHQKLSGSQEAVGNIRGRFSLCQRSLAGEAVDALGLLRPIGPVFLRVNEMILALTRFGNPTDLDWGGYREQVMMP